MKRTRDTFCGCCRKPSHSVGRGGVDAGGGGDANSGVGQVVGKGGGVLRQAIVVEIQ